MLVGAWLLLAAFVLTAWSRINTGKAWRVGALSLTLGFSLIHQLLFATVADEAFITFRYSLNIAEGNGPVFNPGERVEGYSNFLWMIVVALPKALFGWDIVASARVLGVLCTLACVVVAYLLVNRIVAVAHPGEPAGGMPALGVTAAVLTAGASGLAAYGASGLETPLFLLLVLCVCFALTARRPVVAGVLASLAGMTRPDGVVVAVLVGGWLLIAAARKRRTWWSPAGYVLGAVVFAVPWRAWRATYYGYLLSNDVAAKNGGPLGAQLSRGWHYLTEFSLVHQGFLLMGLVAAVAFLHRRNPETQEAEARSLVWLLFGVTLGYSAYVTFIGGDPLPAWRLLAPVPPLLAVASVAAYGVLTAPSGAVPSPTVRAHRRETRLIPVLAFALAGVSLLVTVTSPNVLDSVRAQGSRTSQLGEIGSWLGENLPPGTVISTYDNGALSYRAGTRLQVVDVLGVTDEHIARQGKRAETPTGGIVTDYDYVITMRRPAVAVTPGDGYAAGQHCAIDPVYAGRYQVATFRREGSKNWIALYLRSEQAGTLIPQLDKDSRFVYVACPA
jgi:arabinofuranosyltransferase